MITCIDLALAYTGLTPVLLGKRVKPRVRIELIVDNYAHLRLCGLTRTRTGRTTRQRQQYAKGLLAMIPVVDTTSNIQSIAANDSNKK